MRILTNTLIGFSILFRKKKSQLGTKYPVTIINTLINNLTIKKKNHHQNDMIVTIFTIIAGLGCGGILKVLSVNYILEPLKIEPLHLHRVIIIFFSKFENKNKENKNKSLLKKKECTWKKKNFFHKNNKNTSSLTKIGCELSDLFRFLYNCAYRDFKRTRKF